MAKTNAQKNACEICIYVIKIIAIIYVSIIYGIISLSVTQILDKHVFHSELILLDKKVIEETSLQNFVLHTVLIVGVFGVVSYIFRNIIQRIPFPLDGWYKFDYMRVKEVSSGAVFTTILFAFSETIYKRYAQIKMKLNINH